MRGTLLAIFFILQFGLIAQEWYSVTARSGLSLRAEPGLSAERIGGIPFNAQLELLEPYRYYEVTETIEGVSGYWAPVRYAGQEGYVFSAYLKYGHLFVEKGETVNNEYRIVVPGTRYGSLNYDPNLHWYALVTTIEEGLPTDLKLQKINPFVKFGPEITEFEDYRTEPGIVLLDAELGEGKIAWLYIGAAEPITRIEDLEQICYSSCETEYPMWGKPIYPYQQLNVFQSVDKDNYSLMGLNVTAAKSTHQYRTLDYQLGVVKNTHYRFDEPEPIQSLSAELLPEEWPVEEYGALSFFDHPQLCWQGDLNGDGAPDLVFYRPDTSESCGGSESYSLLVSEQTDGAWRWRKVSEDEIHHEGC